MPKPIVELRRRAELLHRRLQQTDPAFRRRDSLNRIARELGFPNWPEAKRSITGESKDCGDWLCPRRCSAHTNLWYRTYEEAAAIRDQRAEYLLGFRRQFVVVDRYYIESLGLDPDDPDWAAIGFDWVRPRDPEARYRLMAKLVALLPPIEAAAA